jgi:hypothetical protein
MSKAACMFVFLLAAACAMGGSTTTDSNGPQDGPGVHHDASHVTSDAPNTPHDAAIHPLDAFVPQDAPASKEGAFCSDNTGCDSATCCWVAICVLGTPIGTNLCLPQ